MPLSSGFYNSVNGDRVYDAEQFGALFDGIISDGVFPNVGDHFLVRPGTNEMAIYVGSGKAWLNRRWVENTADEKLSISAAHASLDRIDSIVLSVDNNKAVRAARLEVLTGQASGSPQAPLPTDTPGKKYMVLANIRVLKAARQISPEHVSSRVGYGGSNGAPYIGGPANTIDLAGLQNKLQGEFDTWFKAVRDALSQAGGNTATEVANLKASDTAQNLKIANVESRVGVNESKLVNINSALNNASTLFQIASRGNAGLHNSLFRGGSLGNNVNPYLTSIRNGTFDNMFLGDYFSINGVTWRIVAFDYFYGIGYPKYLRHHVIVLPDQPLYTSRYNDTNNIPTAFTSFEIGRTGLNRAISTAQGAFGTGNVLQPLTKFPTSYNNLSQITGSDWLAHTAGLMTEDMIFGRQAISRHDFQRGDLAIGRFPIFELAKNYIACESNYWTRDIATTNSSIYVGTDASEYTAAYTSEQGVRPYFAIG